MKDFNSRGQSGLVAEFEAKSGRYINPGKAKAKNEGRSKVI